MTHRYPLVLAGATCALLVSSVAAQGPQFMLPYGNRLQVTDGSMNTVSLGFNFTMPGGTVVTSVDVDTEGRIVPVGSSTSDSSESTSEMLSGPPVIMSIWDANTYAEDTADIFFNTDNTGTAWITWHDVNTGGVGTWQAQLFANGNIVLVYDSRCPVDDGHVGVCAGGGTLDPGSSDFSAALPTPIATTTPTAYQDFGFGTPESFDLQSTALIFVPNGTGGANGWQVIGTTGVVDPPPAPFAVAETYASSGCFESFSLLFTPDGVGGYDVVKGANQYDSNVGIALGLTSDDAISGGGDGLDLGFAFPFPGGTSSQLVDIDPNGRIVPDGNITFGDLSPSVADLTTDGYPMICPIWTDLNVGEPSSDDVYFASVPGTSATITWKAMAQYDFNDESVPLTVQVKLFSDGRILMSFEDLSGFNAMSSSNDDLLIGVSPGNVADPGEIDVSALVAPVNTGSIAYEYWDASAGVEPVDLVLETAELTWLTAPLLGGNWDIQVQALLSGTVGGVYFVGFMPLGQDLDFIGVPCTLQVNPVATVSAGPDGLGNLTVLSMPVPNDPSLTGLEVFAQGATALPLLTTKAIKGRVGPY